MSRWLCGQRVHAPPREQRPARSRSIPEVYDVYSPVWGCLLLPLCSSQESPQQEGWCQGKRARPLVTDLQTFFFFFPPLCVCPWLHVDYAEVLLCPALLSSFQKYIGERVWWDYCRFSQELQPFASFLFGLRRAVTLPFALVFVFFCDFSSLLLSVTGASRIIFFHLFVLFATNLQVCSYKHD